jgi:L-aspartate oxidase
MSSNNDVWQSDFLVIGTGIAGLSFAIRVAQYGTVNIITKKEDSETNTNYAQGGIAAVMNPADDIQAHIQDTAKAGGGICKPQAIHFLAEHGPQQIQNLMEWGAQFTRDRTGQLELGREGGHSNNRIVHMRDFTGKEVERALLAKARSLPQIQFFNNHYSIDLITQHQAELDEPLRRHYGEGIAAFGAYVFDTKEKRVKTFKAKITMLSTGGSARVYLHSTNPSIATGDGVGMAYRAGAELGNMEFFQFHPTSLYHPGADSFLISEALRGHGAILKDQWGREFMERYHEMASLAPRDIVARAIDNEMKQSGEPNVLLDITHKDPEETKEKFPLIYARCLELGINMTKTPIPVVPAAHYMCGGVKVDLDSRTSIRHLYACGESSFTGVHGANRLASNSLLEAVVFSESAAQAAAQELNQYEHKLHQGLEIPKWRSQRNHESQEEEILVEHNRWEIKNLMWNYVGIVRSNLRLQRARHRLEIIEKEVRETYDKRNLYPHLLELRNLIVVARLTVESALFRKESRGLHYNADYPEPQKAWEGSTILQRGKDPYLEPL